jgi:type III pantothenate kinase
MNSGLEWTVDAGNTMVKWGVWDAMGSLLKVWKEPLTRAGHALPEMLALGRPDKIALSSVSLPRAHWDRLLVHHGLTSWRWMGDWKDWPFEGAYARPDDLGLDRKLQMTGALARHQGDLLILALGSCLTADRLEAAGGGGFRGTGRPVHRGGLIAPGLGMRFRSLHAYTASLPALAPGQSPPTDRWGISTEEAIRSGVHGGLQTEIKALVDAWAVECPQGVLITCGGDVPFLDWTQIRREGLIFAEPDLALHGLRALTQNSFSP